ncbi:Gfo/Idh/MocA family protein [Lachnoclostridium sp. Marseille-P6806]|uniref:Gfo/Idh/MocA family protein n=1 Tax=Lachnoclostridium sp. Marseille-P6806 TaxID=2364793 RepID=UPI00102FE8D8|nr:Gfo/Idh/MocA family oxidoreductase [Lachnoclostridium sp. Marseille-P6806]
MINVAIVGTGNISNLHIQGLLCFPDRCKIVALCDIFPEKAERIKEKYGLREAQVFDDHEAMLRAGLPIDLVHVCTPPSSHAKVAIHVMNAGCHTLVEKPMAPSLIECDGMLKAEADNKVVMGCIAQNRFRNSISKLKKVLDSGLAGKLRCAHINSLWWRGHSYYDLWWRGTWEKEGGGPTLNHAVHHIDMLNWFQGGLPVEVSSMLANVMHDNSEVEDLSFAALRYRDGSVAEVTSSVVHHGEEQGLVLQAEKAKIAAPWSCAAELAQPNGFPAAGHNPELMKELNAYYQSLEDLKYEGHTGEIDDVLSALEQGRRPMITGADGRRTVELITAIYKAGFEKCTVSLPIDRMDEYYTLEGIQKNATHFYQKSRSVTNLDSDQEISVGNYS